MSKSALQEAIATCVERALLRVSDKILRLDGSKDWPVAKALEELNATIPVRALVRRPFIKGDFKGIKVTDDPGKATEWRNDKKRTYAVVVVGLQTGNMDAGLKDVRPVSRREIIEEWKKRVTSAIAIKEELGKPEVVSLIGQLFDYVASGELSATSVEQYLTAAIAKPTLGTVCNHLWQLGLIPDEQAVDKAMASHRIRRNHALVLQLRQSDDSRIDRKLENALESNDSKRVAVAKAAINFRENYRVEDLKKLSLTVLEDILSESAPSSSMRAIGFYDLLDLYTEEPKAVVKCLNELATNWDFESAEAVELVSSFVRPGRKESEQVSLRISPIVLKDPEQEDHDILDVRWTGATDVAAVLAAQSADSSPQGLDSAQQPLSPKMLTELAPPEVPVQAYLECRSALRAYEPWIERNGLALFILIEEARIAARKFIDAWAKVAKAAASLMDQAIFIETIQVLETVQGTGADGNPAWLVLGPLHPFRLDPLVRIAELVSEWIDGKGEVQSIGEAAQWMLDRSFPAYPTIHRSRTTLHLSSIRGMVVYNRSPAKYLPAVREANGLDRVIRAIEGYSPWLHDGISLLVVDAPEGGGVVRALERARARRPSNAVTLFHLTTSSEADSLDTYNGEIEYLPRVKRLGDAQDLPPSNIVLRFAAEAGGGEAAGPQWNATKGTHLALKISEVPGGPFSSEKTPQIKIDPGTDNLVVCRMQALYQSLSGSLPTLATIKPLLRTDDAAVLSRMANGADWIVFGAPGPLGLVAPRTINKTLRFVGRSTMGNYGLYVYSADEMFPVRRFFEDHFRQWPVSAVPPDLLTARLMDKAQQGGQAVLFTSLINATAQIAALMAVEIANQESVEGDEVFVLSLDDLGWTRAWLGDGVRADYLVVYIRKDGTVLLRVVESKSDSSGEAVPCEEGQKAYKEGIEQARTSLRALRDVVDAAESRLDQELRFASLIEHLMAAILMKSGELDGARRQRIYEVVNDLSGRTIAPKFDAMVVLSQPGVKKPRLVKQLDDELRIVWAGAPEAEAVFGLGELDVAPAAEVVEGDVEVAEEGRPIGAVDEPSLDSTTSSAPVLSHEVKTSQKAQSRSAEIARVFIAAAKIHGISILGDDAVYVQEGPSLLAMGIRLREGTTIQPLRARLPDIARDIGLGDRAAEMEVENDAEPRTVRVLLPREDRQFPVLPAQEGAAVGQEGYLPLFIGQTVDAKDWTSTIESWPHMLVAGTTGSGKTTFIRSILKQLRSYGSERLQVVVVDGKGDTDYLGVLPKKMFPPQFSDLQLGADAAVEVLKWAVDEMEQRRKLIHKIAQTSKSPQPVKAADVYRASLRGGGEPTFMPLVLVIDEFADIMLAGKKSAEQFEDLVQRICQVGRSRLIHLVLGTQRPDKETIRGSIKANLNTRAVFRLPTQADSMTVLGRSGAERLMLHGDMLFQHGTANPLRLQGYQA